MHRQRLRQILSVVIVLATIIVFVIYFKQHPKLLRTLLSVPPLPLGSLFVLYVIFIGTIAWIQQATLQLCGIRLKPAESMLLMSYSAIVNFFGPLQSGPGFRAAYLKAKHDVNLKKYTVATLLYYAFYALFSGLLILTFVIGCWVGALSILAIGLAPLARRIRRFRALDFRAVRNLALATLAQSVVQSFIYLIELHTLLHHISYLQALIYTGAANFALFVSITPGAIGFRESFLLLAQRLHHISSATIATASVIDRAVYVSLLAIMSIGIFGFHANNRLKLQGASSKTELTDAK